MADESVFFLRLCFWLCLFTSYHFWYRHCEKPLSEIISRKKKCMLLRLFHVVSWHLANISFSSRLNSFRVHLNSISACPFLFIVLYSFLNLWMRKFFLAFFIFCVVEYSNEATLLAFIALEYAYTLQQLEFPFTEKKRIEVNKVNLDEKPHILH